MEFGIAIPTAADSWKIVQRAEELGFSHAWFYDTQMLCADCFVAMAAAAMRTSRIRLGTGVLIPSNRIAPVTANALATLNALAPGRIDFGVGTGFTGRRTMGLGAMKQSDMEEYIRVVMALLEGETPEYDAEGTRRRITFLNPELKLINLRDEVKLHVSAYGPRGRALTARLGAGWLNFVGDVAGGVAAMRAMAESWDRGGNDMSDLTAVAFALGCVLQPGEDADSERGMAQAGPRAAVQLHRAADEALSGLPNTSPVPEALRESVAGYVELANTFTPADARYLTNHRGHLMAVKAIERPFVTAEMIRQATFTGTGEDLLARIGALRDGGYTQFAIQMVPGHEAAIEDWAKLKAAF
jgi:5,10-methylenetetrahydromethanopterin reductase